MNLIGKVFYLKDTLKGDEKSVIRVELNEKAKHARVIVDQSQLSIAIGKAGQNVRLASKLSGYELDIESGVQKPVDEPSETEELAEQKPEQPVVAETKKPTKPKRRDDIEAGLLGAIEAHGE